MRYLLRTNTSNESSIIRAKSIGLGLENWGWKIGIGKLGLENWGCQIRAAKLRLPANLVESNPRLVTLRIEPRTWSRVEECFT